ncbi:hypothetical protein FGO68_gene13547 [Halteria grandinella]|uniref:TATA box-binding protein-associated factor RNA polymerase I subunit B n=1 Tax=Halteria grandinella TaxID=5974 RepID=A0A8J8SXM0_HALGN|nr:hypothetical protein FGO68_gene13547 [Halteria grandinella]
MSEKDGSFDHEDHMHYRGGGQAQYPFGDAEEDQGGFQFQIDQTMSYQQCNGCGGKDFTTLDGQLICSKCGIENQRHAMNIEVEYQDIQRNFNAKMRVEAVKKKAIESPKKKGGIADMSVFQPGRFIVIGGGLFEQRDAQMHITQDEELDLLRSNNVETDQLYIKAFQKILKKCATQFAILQFADEEKIEAVVEGTMSLLDEYLSKWKTHPVAQHCRPIGSITLPRRGQLRVGDKRPETRLDSALNQQSNHGNGPSNSFNLQSGESNQPVMIETDYKVIEREIFEAQQYLASNQLYKQKLKCTRRRALKQEDKLSNGSTTGNSQSEVTVFQKMNSNFQMDIQSLTGPEHGKIVLSLDSQECVFLSLLQRAKLFVKLIYSQKCKTLKETVRNIKFKKQSNVFISDSTLPNKSQLIKIVKDELFLDYRQFKVEGVKSIKEKIILLIFIFHKVVSQQISTFQNRSEMYEQLLQNCLLVYEQEKSESDLIKLKPEVLLSETFLKLLSDESPDLRNEFELLCGKVSQEAQLAPEEVMVDLKDFASTKQPETKFDFNLILAFIYMASRGLGILEKDVLLAAQNDSFGYLTAYREHLDLKKATYALRPVNVPFKNKWLRDTVAKLHLKDGISIGQCDLQKLIYRITSDLDLPIQVTKISISISHKIKLKNLSVELSPQFDAIACVLMALKLLYGLNDSKQQPQIDKGLPNLEDLISLSQQKILDLHPPSTLWKLKSLEKVTDIKSQLKFAQDRIQFSKRKLIDPMHSEEEREEFMIDGEGKGFSQFSNEEEKENVRRFRNTCSTLSTKFSASLQKFKLKKEKQQAEQDFQSNDCPEFEFKILDKPSHFEQAEEILQPSSNYAHYDFKLVNYDCEFFHFQFMRVVQVFQDYLNEPTCQDIIKAFRNIEKALLT